MPKKNRLILEFSGVIDEEEANEAIDCIVSELAELEPGFDLINDISNFKLVERRAMNRMKKLLKYLEKSGVGRIVRICNKMDLGVHQFNMAIRESNVGLSPAVVCYMAEAENMLDSQENTFNPNKVNMKELYEELDRVLEQTKDIAKKKN